MNIVVANVPYHQQDEGFECGKAVAQMLLRGLGRPLASQGDIAELLKGCGQNDDWSTSPDALTCILNAHRPKRFSQQFIVHADNERDVAMRRLAATITGTGIAVPAVVMENKHWVCVRGVAFDEPASPGLPATIRGFYINNPMPITARKAHSKDHRLDPYPRPFPHADDDACGIGSIFGTGCEYVSAYGWISDYWSAPASTYGAYITISNVPQSPYAAQSFRVGPPLPTVGGPNLGEAAARAAAEHQVKSNPAATRGPLAERLRHPKAMPQSPGQSNDASGSTYYIVTVVCDGGLAQVSIDKANGALRGFQAPAGTTIPDSYTAEAALGALQQQSLRFRHLFDADQLRLEDVVLDPKFFWSPCLQTRSPFIPIGRVTVRGHQMYFIDGQVYETLEDVRA